MIPPLIKCAGAASSLASTSGRTSGAAHQVPPEPPACSSSQRQSGAFPKFPKNRPHRVLEHSRSQGPSRKAPREVLEAQLARWQTFYNQQRTHNALGSQTPLQRLQEKQPLIPSPEAVQAAYDPTKVKPTKNTPRTPTALGRPLINAHARNKDGSEESTSLCNPHLVHPPIEIISFRE